MSANTKWERVDVLALMPGDKVRVTHDNGDTFHGTIKPGIHSDRTIVLDNLLLPGLSMDAVQGRGYTVERAVPERTLPTRPGVYVSASALRNEVPSDVKFYARQVGRWSSGGSYISEGELPDDLAYIATEHEVEDAERIAESLLRRIEAVQEYLNIAEPHNVSSYAEDRIGALLNGEASDV